jgi:glyoxylase-like metal-dependent hydrolase (beta-lactamase superfamily II)
MAVQIKKVAQDTYLLDCGKDPFLSLINIAYFLDDEMPVLIDPGSGTAAAELFDGVGQAGIDLQRLSYIIPTHIHLDHAGGAGYLAQRLPKPKVVLHPRGATHLTDPSVLVQGARLIFGQDFEQSLGSVVPIPRERVHVASDGEVIRLAKRELKVVYSPGHAAHHIALLDSLTEGLFCGDALGFLAEGTSDVPFPIGLSPFDPRASLETIDKLAALHPKVLFYAHHGPRTEVDQLFAKFKEVCVAFDDIIRKGIEADEDDQQISQRILDYSSGLAQQAELPVFARVGISGYIQYYRNHRNNS